MLLTLVHIPQHHQQVGLSGVMPPLTDTHNHSRPFSGCCKQHQSWQPLAAACVCLTRGRHSWNLGQSSGQNDAVWLAGRHRNKDTRAAVTILQGSTYLAQHIAEQTRGAGHSFSCIQSSQECSGSKTPAHSLTRSKEALPRKPLPARKEAILLA